MCDAHRKAAEHHELAAQAHCTAAEHDEREDNGTRRHSERALEHQIMLLLLVNRESCSPASAGKGAIVARFLRRCRKHNPGATGPAVHASDTGNQAPQLSIRRVRPVSHRRRSARGWH